MDEYFYLKYRNYESFPIEEFVLIPDMSIYNHNYYLGLKRENMVTDLIYVETDELSGISEYYHIDNNKKIHLGYSYEGDKFITLQEEELT